MNPDIKITVLTSLFNCIKYLDGYFDCLSNLNNTQNIEILLLHNAPSKEELAIIEQKLPIFPFVKHIIISEREGLYSTWNRGIKLAKGEYICVWNVDDIRMPNSIFDQADTLDKNSDADLTYGDFYYMFEYPIESNVLVVNKEFQKNSKNFFRSHQIGCFPMWRKNIHDKIGYFDEQFKLVADFDFQIRATRSNLIIKTDKVLGYYLENVPEKLSSNSWKQSVERNVLYLRYGMFDLFNWLTLFSIVKNYRVNYLSYNNSIIPLHEKFHLYRTFIFFRIPLFLFSIFRQPKFVLSSIKHNILRK